MNEITNIHLGRQPFIVAVDAHRALRAYLREIGEQVGDNKDVLEEVELRMAELLTERGISAKKVVIMADVEYLKKQLGEPADFHDDEHPENKGADKSHHPEAGGRRVKRLYRDTNNAMLGGVSAGLAAYFGIDPIIVRLLFVVLTFASGAGILLYILLWLLVPAARSESDRLKMRGKPVTVESLSEAVSEADMHRAGTAAERMLKVIGMALLIIFGVGFILTGIVMIIGAATAASFTAVHGISVGGELLFPVDGSEMLTVFSWLAVLLVLSALFILAGRAMIRRKWSFPGWGLAALAAVFIAGSTLGTATTINSVEEVSERAERLTRTEMRSLDPFEKVETNTGDVRVEYVTDTRYAVEIRTIGDTDIHTITTTVKDKKLFIDAGRLEVAERCTLICPYGPSNVKIIVHAPHGIVVEQTGWHVPDYQRPGRSSDGSI